MPSPSDAFTAFAEQNTPPAVKARQRAAAKRRERAAEKELQERADLFRIWRQWRRARLDALLAGPHSAKVQALIAFLEGMTLDQGPELIEHVRAAGWQRADADTKFEILSLINSAITALRERAGLAPFDDGIPPEEEPSVLVILREIFR
jgi:muconolactone delta-isomerase